MELEMTTTLPEKFPPAPPVRGGLVAYLQVASVVDAIAFYKRAFGAELAFMVPVDDQGRTMHAHLYVNGSSLMLSDPYPDHGHPSVRPQGFTLQLVVDDIDAWWRRAVEAGAEVVVPVQLMFWGDRYGQVRDPFGVVWAMNAPVVAK